MNLLYLKTSYRLWTDQTHIGNIINNVFIYRNQSSLVGNDIGN